MIFYLYFIAKYNLGFLAKSNTISVHLLSLHRTIRKVTSLRHKTSSVARNRLKDSIGAKPIHHRPPIMSKTRKIPELII